MAKAKKSVGKKATPKKAVGSSAAKKKPAKKAPAKRTAASSKRSAGLKAAVAATGPVSLAEARALAGIESPQRTALKAAAPQAQAVTHKDVADERLKLHKQIQAEHARRIREYKAIMTVMKARGVKGLATAAAGAGMLEVSAAAAAQPMQIFAEGDSWFDYPVPFFGGGVIPRLENLLGIPILNLAKAGDEARNMLGVDERKILMTQLQNGSPAGGAWDVLLFSGGGNDIVGNPMALWISDFNAAVPPATLINTPRFAAALALVEAAYEDLIALRDSLSPTTQLIFHGYDFAIPDGRGVCGYGPWMKPTFDLRGFPSVPMSFLVVKAMLGQFAAMLQLLASRHSNVTVLTTQGTLAPVTASWHNELHPSRDGFNKITAVFHAKLQALFPGRVL